MMLVGLEVFGQRAEAIKHLIMMLGHSDHYGGPRHNQNTFHLTLLYVSMKGRQCLKQMQHGSNLPVSIRDKVLVKVKERKVSRHDVPRRSHAGTLSPNFPAVRMANITLRGYPPILGHPWIPLLAALRSSCSHRFAEICKRRGADTLISDHQLIPPTAHRLRQRGHLRRTGTVVGPSHRRVGRPRPRVLVLSGPVSQTRHRPLSFHIMAIVDITGRNDNDRPSCRAVMMARPASFRLRRRVSCWGCCENEDHNADLNADAFDNNHNRTQHDDVQLQPLSNLVHGNALNTALWFLTSPTLIMASSTALLHFPVNTWTMCTAGTRLVTGILSKTGRLRRRLYCTQ
ncbi:hypothetical protein BJX68DRAFT_168304 [Aspergillus pseudodeflectus]|uniref:Uncharacterized protein n=1 Tax=Aspergillus pseudodeflectus TaxID=176178 RepID=A0ABR4JQL8_9EURO